MKPFLTILFLVIITTASAQQVDYNTNKNFVAEGYDVTEYFNNKAVKGNSKFIATHDKVGYKFATQKNLEKFKKNPNKYVPQYGGYCAYAVAINNEKVDINPKTFEVRDGKLYLFYNSWGINTLDKWLEEDASKLQKKADVNWQKIKIKK
ncbi:YHS domain-containing protein [Aquimarina sp. MAR_2010_214]|uniref:YHS domain-containing (seleno)protein n=1 Tax=Aquimarina sp. MAR_2010_214 TaxID=1250026 RepID=UPI000C7027FE|nr:YHS domain-containing (seleno)protein [Aquimarina sp. MAR_2010_214]PKV48319.1 YHS domain-containing protein [Aquimarina sp. MAR_2010_214]